MRAWLKRQWRRCVAGAGIVAVSIAAIFAVQQDVPVDHAPDYRHVSNERIEIRADFSTATSIGTVVVPAGFQCDGASIPKAAWSVLGIQPFSGCSIRAAVVHDWLYRTQPCSREQADAVFLELLLADGCQPDKAECMYRMVREFGKKAWDSHPAISM